MTCTSSLAMRRYSIEPRQENMLKNMDFYRLQKYIYKKTIIGERTRLFKKCSQKGSP